METDQKINECILNINVRVINIQQVKAAYRPLQIQSGSPVDSDIMFFSIVKICTIIEELKILNRFCKDDKYLRDVFFCLNPLQDYIMQYEKGCFLVRNNVVAHFQRDKLGNFKPFWSILKNLHIPRDNREWDFLYDCLDVIRVVLISRYPNFEAFSLDKHALMTTEIDEFSEQFQPKAAIDINLIKADVNRRLREKKFIKEQENFFKLVSK